ncbi:hypothetical protein A3D11_04190 [Candidatus Peribacteria bacterium RIFCSPHIGHO2_02_FULL_49_16]|nr:MAG: hypothetical protein A2880_00280 [Candidatus Peribacteria bacterium RIFCSPHIGHO2_01_FULL_49_38]OGJ59197.1 MAG: hypothetical protein A3D11_04190 [Candidatus Peribacteria bacterium RIFCSPHIGHO2_02_FULL_49_16]
MRVGDTYLQKSYDYSIYSLQREIELLIFFIILYNENVDKHYMQAPWKNIWPFARQLTLTEKAIGYGFLLLNIVGGSVYPSLARQLSTVFSPFSLLFIGEFSILFFLILSFGFVPLMRKVLALHTRQILLLILMGMFVAVGIALWILGLSGSGAANAEVLIRIELILILFFSTICLKETFSRTHALAAFLILLGVLVVFLRNLNGGFHINTGDFFIMGAAVFLSVSSILLKRYLNGIPPEAVLFVRSLTAFSLFFFLSPFEQVTFVAETKMLTGALLLPLLAYAFLARFLGVLSFYEAVERLPLSNVHLLLPLTTVGSISFAHLYLGENIHWQQIVGGGLIILGSYVLNVKGKMHETQKQHIAHLKQKHRHH